jgi:hypothetical protein
MRDGEFLTESRFSRSCAVLANLLEADLNMGGTPMLRRSMGGETALGTPEELADEPHSLKVRDAHVGDLPAPLDLAGA